MLWTILLYPAALLATILGVTVLSLLLLPLNELGKAGHFLSAVVAGVAYIWIPTAIFVWAERSPLWVLIAVVAGVVWNNKGRIQGGERMLLVASHDESEALKARAALQYERRHAWGELFGIVVGFFASGMLEAVLQGKAPIGYVS